MNFFEMQNEILNVNRSDIFNKYLKLFRDQLSIPTRNICVGEHWLRGRIHCDTFKVSFDVLQILGNAVGIDLGLLDLVVHHHDLLGKRHFQMHALAQYPIRNLSHGDDHAGVSRRNDGHSRRAGDQSQKHYRTNEDPVPQFVVFHRHSFPEQLKCSFFLVGFLKETLHKACA